MQRVIKTGSVLAHLKRGRKLLRGELTEYAQACGFLTAGTLRMAGLAQAA